MPHGFTEKHKTKMPISEGGISDGDKGDITVSGSTWTVDNGLNASKIADGSVSNTEFQYLNGVTSSIQTQIDGKQASLGYTAENTANKGAANGYAPLDSSSNVPMTNLLLPSQSAFATAETSISAATYADITGCSITLDAGTWIIFAHIVCRSVNAIIQAFGAITDGSNNVIAESTTSRPASGTTNLNSLISMNFQAIVTPTGSTTYKLRAARGVTTHTATYTVVDGTGYNTSNHASNNSDKGTSIIAIRIG